MADTKQSIAATYDSRKTGPRYWVTDRINSRTLTFQRPVDDPFVRHTIRVGWIDLVKSLLRGRLEVEVMVGADRELMDDVLELDDNQLVPGRTRAAEFRSGINKALKDLAVDEELREMTGSES